MDKRNMEYICIFHIWCMMINIALCYGCGIPVYKDSISDRELIAEPLKEAEWQRFRGNMQKALDSLPGAKGFLYSLPAPEVNQPWDTPGEGFCPGKRKYLHGFWTKYGHLCMVVESKVQDVSYIQCEQNMRCTEDRACQSVGYSRMKFLVFCDKFFLPDDKDDSSTNVTQQSSAISGHFFFAYRKFPQECLCMKHDCFSKIHKKPVEDCKKYTYN